MDRRGYRVRRQASSADFSFSPLPDPDVEWDGTDDAGKPVPDGVYSYSLRALDNAGNSFASTPVSVSVDTAKKAVRLVADLKAFSPLPGSAKDRLTLTAQVLSNDKVRSYELSIVALDATAERRTGPGRRPHMEGRQGRSRDLHLGRHAPTRRAGPPTAATSARLAVSYLNGDAADSPRPAFSSARSPPRSR